MLKGLKYFGIIICLATTGIVCQANEEYLIVPVPDTIVAPVPLDQAVYTNTAEFFMPYIINEINKTNYMQAPTITDVRNKIQKDYWLTKSAAKVMDDFRRYYVLDFNFAKKVGDLYNTNLVLFLTSSLDATNYVMRRTWWTFFEIPGASSLDPAIKINIYSVLIDTDKNMIVWSKTYQKTISTVENRIVPTGYTPQTEQLQRFKDYSVYLAPRFAQSLQNTLLTASQKVAEPNMIHTDYGSIDNVFTKKYRSLRKEIKDAMVVPAAKIREVYGKIRAKHLEAKEQREKDKVQKAIEKQNDGIEPVNSLIFLNSVENNEVTPAVETPADVNVQAAPVNALSAVENDNGNIQTDSLQVEGSVVSENQPADMEQKDVITAPSSSEEKPAVNVTKSKKDNEDNIVKINSTQNQSSVSDEELPVDSLIYTQPTNYGKENDYLPLKPRIREINIDDTVNSF